MSGIRVVAAGCGRMSTNFLKAALATGEVEVVGLVDPDVARAEERRAELSLDGAAVGPDLAAMLVRERPEAVFDIVVPSVRHQVATTALEHGCHVLTEKPMADTLENARDLIRASRAAGRVHAVIQNRRYHPGVRRIARFLRDGGIGEVTGLYCDFFLGPHFGGFREEMRHVLLLDMAIHTFDVGRLFAGGAAASVWCREWNPANSWYAHGASAIAVFEMGGGAVFNYRGSWCAEGLRTSWESAWRITGTRGTLLWDGEDDMRAEVVRRVGGPPSLFSEFDPVTVPALDPGDRVGGHRGVIEDFIQAIRTGQPPETTGSENIKSLAMVAGAIESAETAQLVHITKAE
ncbi:MAG: Gfo/Idh/MocA family protein [Janthinobacterium lividum]